MELIRAACHVAPMQGTSDGARYVTDICRTLNWVHPMQIIKVAIDGPDVVTNPLAIGGDRAVEPNLGRGGDAQGEGKNEGELEGVAGST